MLAHQPAVLERHAIGFGELQVGDSLRGLQGQRPALGEALAVEVGEPEEAVLALPGHFRRRAVGTEEIVDVEFVERDQPRHASATSWSDRSASGAWPATAPAAPAIWERRRRCRRTRPWRGRESEGANPCRQALSSRADRFMTVRSLISALTQQEDINFLLTNRVPAGGADPVHGLVQQDRAAAGPRPLDRLLAAVFRPRSVARRARPISRACTTASPGS